MEEAIKEKDGEFQPLPMNLQILQPATMHDYNTAKAMNYSICCTTMKRTCVPCFLYCCICSKQEFEKIQMRLQKWMILVEYPRTIHSVLLMSYEWCIGMKLLQGRPAPLSLLVQLLIEMHPQGLHIKDHGGYIQLHYAVGHPCIDCFHAVLYNGSQYWGNDNTTTQEIGWWTHAFAWMHRWWVEYWACSIVGIASLQPWFCDKVHTKSLATEKNNFCTPLLLSYRQPGR